MKTRHEPLARTWSAIALSSPRRSDMRHEPDAPWARLFRACGRLPQLHGAASSSWMLAIASASRLATGTSRTALLPRGRSGSDVVLNDSKPGRVRICRLALSVWVLLLITGATVRAERLPIRRTPLPTGLPITTSTASSKIRAGFCGSAPLRGCRGLMAMRLPTSARTRAFLMRTSTISWRRAAASTGWRPMLAWSVLIRKADRLDA